MKGTKGYSRYHPDWLRLMPQPTLPVRIYDRYCPCCNGMAPSKSTIHKDFGWRLRAVLHFRLSTGLPPFPARCVISYKLLFPSLSKTYNFYHYISIETECQ